MLPRLESVFRDISFATRLWRRNKLVTGAALVSLSTLVSIIDFVRDPSTVWSLAIGGIIAALIILALWAGRSAEFFRRSRAR